MVRQTDLHVLLGDMLIVNHIENMNMTPHIHFLNASMISEDY